MAIIAKDMIVGGVSINAPPAKPLKVEPVKSFSDVHLRRNIPVVEQPALDSKYHVQEHGELVKHINTKSSYQLDMIHHDTDSN